MFEEERRFSERRDQFAKQFERLSNEVTEKLDRVTKRLVEIQSLGEEEENMQDVLETAESSYLRAIESLELTLQSEAERSKMLLDQLNEISERYKKLQIDHEEFMRRTEEETEACQRLYAELLKQIEALQIELSQTEEEMKTLSNQFNEKDALFKKFDASITADLKRLEDQYNTKLELLQKREEKLSVSLPVSEKLQMELRETTTTFEGQKDLFTGLKEEELTLAKSTARSVKEVDRLRRLKGYLKGEIHTRRTVAYGQLNTFSESLKFLERDSYEINRKLYIVNAENARFREAIAHLRAEISTLDSEAEAYRSKRQEVQKEVIALHDLFDKRWSEDKQLSQLFLKRERKILKALEEHGERFKNRNALVTYVGSGLQLNYEGLTSLLKRQSSMELKQGSSPTTSSTTT
ncbi:myosin-4-like [Eublepharis macularius]|uniref:Myosin-4-like n=1 Tax=Eublepharis macularius TaxID=481883 RepID=A0AA97IUJ8_EUBMA|nr:myosin-4-like [Eublepharis macularius]